MRFENVKLHAEALGNEALRGWLIERGQTLEGDIGKLRSGLNLLKRLGSVISGQ